MKTKYTYVFVRSDIKKSQIVVQACHACYEASRKLDPAGEASHMVILDAGHRKDLLEISDILAQRCIEYEIFFEPDNGMGESAIATRPISKGERNHFKKFKLLDLDRH